MPIYLFVIFVYFSQETDFKKSICLFLNPIVELVLFCLYMSVIPIKYANTNYLPFIQKSAANYNKLNKVEINRYIYIIHNYIGPGVCIVNAASINITRLYCGSQFVGGENRSIGRKPMTYHKSLTNFITLSCNEYTLP